MNPMESDARGGAELIAASCCSWKKPKEGEAPTPQQLEAVQRKLPGFSL